jgi:flagellar biosynthesis/type III secretory pathway M-ring protein FliF/YscJ
MFNQKKITMKNLSSTSLFKYFAVTLLFSCFQLIGLGQDSGTTSTTVKTTTTEHTEWYTAPWVWIVGGIVVVILLVAIISSGRRSRTTVTDTGAGTRTITTDD